MLNVRVWPSWSNPYFVSMQPLNHLLRFFFRLLYHSFAWAYDLVAWTVSLGRWNDWVESVIPFIKRQRVLELGHGPGHLQRILLDLGLLPIGLDESQQMGFLAKNRLHDLGYTKVNVVRGVAQFIPFPVATFDNVLATFPSEYIFDNQTLVEASRVLNNGGRLIVLPVAWITGASLLDRFAAWLFHVTGQVPSDISEEAINQMVEPFIEAGFQVETKQLEVKSSLVLIIIAEKK